MAFNDGKFLYDLEVEVESELVIAESSQSEAPDSRPDEWVYDPTDLDREEVGLRNMLGAVEALERDAGQ